MHATRRRFSRYVYAELGHIIGAVDALFYGLKAAVLEVVLQVVGASAGTARQPGISARRGGYRRRPPRTPTIWLV